MTFGSFRAAAFAALVFGLISGPLHPARGQAEETPRTTLTGQVAETFADRFILHSGTERLLVEPSGPPAAVEAAAGDTVSVEGRKYGPIFKADRVERLKAAVRGVAEAAPAVGPRDLPVRDLPARDLPGAVRALGLEPIDAPVTKKHHIEILARMSDGRSVYVSFDRTGRLWEIEDAAHDKDAAAARGLSRADYERLAREAGFSPTGGFEEKRRHVEVEARNRAGEMLVLHIDRAGYIYKQVWLR